MAHLNWVTKPGCDDRYSARLLGGVMNDGDEARGRLAEPEPEPEPLVAAAAGEAECPCVKLAAEAAEAEAKGDITSRRSTTLAPTAMLDRVKAEFSVHTLSKSLRRTLLVCFNTSIEEYLQAQPGATGEPSKEQIAVLAEDVIGIPVWQPSHLDLTIYPSDEVSKERDRLFVHFKQLAGLLRDKLTAAGHWVDASCPVTGYAMFGGRGGCTWNELESLTQMLKYRHQPAGCCGIVLHPEWGKKAYPVTIFTTAATEAVEAAWRELDKEFDLTAAPGPVLEGSGCCV